MDAVTRLLSDLVAIPSINPMGRPLSGPNYLERGVTDYLDAWFRDRGVRYERQNIAPGRDNVIAWYDAPKSRQTILFDAHQDTVPAEGMSIDPFDPVVRSGRLYGRGSCDIKGGLAGMLMAFDRLVKERPAGSASVVMACTVDEEFTHTGSSRLAATDLGAILGVVAEPTMLDVVNCHKGAVRWKIRTHGTACHSSTPALGDNAIYRMAAVVSALAEHACQLAADPAHPVLGRPSLSVGRIEGGQSVNVVPDLCEIEIDRRIIPGESPESVIARVSELLRSKFGPTDNVEFLPPWVKMPALAPEGCGSAPWLEPVRAAVASVLGKTPDVRGVPFGTDAGPLGQAGLPCFVFGPGDIAQAHTKDEWVELDQVRASADAYFAIACGLGG